MEIKCKEISVKNNGTCYICNEESARGPHIVGKLICSSCINEISTTNIAEVKYNVYKEIIKSIINK